MATLKTVVVGGEEAKAQSQRQAKGNVTKKTDLTFSQKSWDHR